MNILKFFRGDKSQDVTPLTEDALIGQLVDNKPIARQVRQKTREEMLTEAMQSMAWAIPANNDAVATADSQIDGYGVSTAIPMDIVTWYARQTFIGWQACSIMSTHWLIGRACAMPIDDALKNGWEITACSTDTSISDDVAKILHEAEKKHDIRNRLHNFGFFGRVFGVRVAIFRIDGYTADEYGKPLNFDDVSSGRKYKGFALVDPQYCTPVMTNTSNPIADDFMKVTYWQVGGIRYHHSFCVEYIHKPVSQTMKGVYMNAGGISLVQEIYEKVYLAEQSAAEANRLLFSKRVWVRSGDVESALMDQVAFESKMNFFARAINNFGTLLLGENEQLNKHETSLQEVTGVIGQKFEHVSAVAGIPSNRLMMTQLSGFASSGEAEEKIYIDLVSSIQCNLLEPVLEMHTKLTLLSNDLPADDFKVTFNPATSLTAKELADINAQKAQTDSTLAQIQAISPEAIADKWAKDPHGGYAGIDLADYAVQEQDDFNADMAGFDGVDTEDGEARWVTVGGGTSAETGEGTGRHFQIDTDTGKILKGGGAGMVGKTFKEAFSDDNKNLTERQKLSRRITAHAAKKHGGDRQDFTRLTNKGAEGKSSDWHAKTFLKEGNVPSEYQEKAKKQPSEKPTESATKNLARQVKEMASGNIPYYTMPTPQAKDLEKKGFIIRGDMGEIELTEKGRELLSETAQQPPTPPTNSGAVSEQPSGEQQEKAASSPVLSNNLTKGENASTLSSTSEVGAAFGDKTMKTIKKYYNISKNDMEKKLDDMNLSDVVFRDVPDETNPSMRDYHEVSLGFKNEAAAEEARNKLRNAGFPVHEEGSEPNGEVYISTRKKGVKEFQLPATHSAEINIPYSDASYSALKDVGHFDRDTKTWHVDPVALVEKMDSKGLTLKGLGDKELEKALSNNPEYQKAVAAKEKSNLQAEQKAVTDKESALQQSRDSFKSKASEAVKKHGEAKVLEYLSDAYRGDVAMARKVMNGEIAPTKSAEISLSNLAGTNPPSQVGADFGDSKMNKQDFLEKHFPHAAKNIQSTKGSEYHNNNVDFHLNIVMQSANNDYMKPISGEGGGEYSSIQQANFMKAVEDAANEEKPRLNGSEKQIEWANGIRDKSFEKLNYLKNVLENINYDAVPPANHELVKKSVGGLLKNIEAIKSIDSAKKWIDIKYLDMSSPMINPTGDRAIFGMMASAQNDKFQKPLS